MKLKVISVILAVLVAFTFGVNSFTVRSSAVAATSVALSGLVAVLGSALSYCVTTLIDWGPNLSDRYLNAVNNNAVQNGELIEIWQDSDGEYHFQSLINKNDPDYSDDDKAFNEFICDYFNNHIDESAGRYISSFKPFGNSTAISTVAYGQLKQDAVNAYLNYCENNERIKESGYGAIADYLADYFHFDLAGAISSITTPNVSAPAEFDFEGFSFTETHIAPHPHAQFYEFCYDEASAHNWWTGDISICNIVENGNLIQIYHGTVQINKTCYGMGWCVIYNGKPYFMPIINKSADIQTIGRCMCSNIIAERDRVRFVSADGESLSTAGCTQIEGNPYCLYYIIDPNVEYNYPHLTSDEQFYTTTGGTSDVDLTDDEALINAAINNQILDKNPELVIGADGSIESADGISLDTLAELLQGIADGQIDTKDLMTLLTNIRNILTDGFKVNNGYLDKIISQYAKYWKSSADDLDEINTTIQDTLPGIKQGVNDLSDDMTDIKDNVQSIADSIAAAQEAEYSSNMDRDFNMYLISHVGLEEANNIVNNVPLVQQLTVLFDIAFDPDTYTPERDSSAPSFKFYYDWDKDGNSEVYNALDLSFFDEELTNTNLEDKSRFSSSPTIREYIRGLILMVCYILFAIKVYKNLSGLISGSLSGTHAIDTVTHKK